MDFRQPLHGQEKEGMSGERKKRKERRNWNSTASKPVGKYLCWHAHMHTHADEQTGRKHNALPRARGQAAET